MNKRLLTLGATLVLAAATLSPPAMADLTGNVGVVSQYILRGITNSPEDDKAAIQGGFDWNDPSGFYLGYWGSNLGYNSSPTYTAQGFENDFYGGYNGSLGKVSYSVGAVQYYYVNVSHANGTEFTGSLGMGPLSLGVHSLLEDVAWGNKGDTYTTLSFSQDLPKGFSFSALAGYYFYKDSGTYIRSTRTGGGFRDLDLTLSHPIANTGATMSLTYIIGGKDRDGVAQDNAMVLGFNYGFDIK